MDAKPQNAEIDDLVQRAELARQSLRGHYQSLRHRIDVPARLKENFSNNRTLWFGASALAGLLATRLFRRPVVREVSTPRKRKGFTGLALSAAFALAKPALKTLVFAEIKKRLLPAQEPVHKPASTRPFSR